MSQRGGGERCHYDLMTEEELELLAEYGTRTAFDVLLPGGEMRDASAFQSEFGGKSLFLTGTGEGEGDAEADAKAAWQEDDLPALIAMPLELFTLKTSVDVTSATTSTQLTSAIDGVVAAAAAASSSTTRMAGRRSPIDHDGIAADDGDDVFAMLDEMHREADEAIRHKDDYHYVPDGSEGRALAAVMFQMTDNIEVDVPETNTLEDEAIAAMTAEDGGVDPFSLIPPSAAPRTEGTTLPEVLTHADEEAICDAVERRLAAEKEAHASSITSFAPLFEGEGEASIQQRIEAAQYQEDLMRKRAVFSALAVEKVRELAAKSCSHESAVGPEVLAMAARHAAELNNVNDDSSPLMATPQKEAGASRQQRSPQPPPRPQDGSAPDPAPRPFVTSPLKQQVGPPTSMQHAASSAPRTTESLIDRLLALPVSNAPAATAETANADAFPGVQKRGSGNKKAAVSAEVQKKRRERRAWLMAREAEERGRMRVEEDDTMKALRYAKAAALTHAKERAALEEDERRGRREVAGEEGLSIADICRKAEKQMSHLREWGRHMAALAHTKALADEEEAEARARGVIEEGYTQAIEDALQASLRARSVLDHMFALRNAVVMSSMSRYKELVGEEADSWGDLLTIHCREESREVLRAADRAAEAKRKTLEEKAKAQEEQRAAVEALVERSLEHILRQIDIEGLRQHAEGVCTKLMASRRRQGGYLGTSSARPSTPPPSSSSSSSTRPNNEGSEGEVLNAESFRRVQAACFQLLSAASPSNPQQTANRRATNAPRLSATLVFRNLSFALEQLCGLDHASLAHLTVAMPSTAAAGSQKGGDATTVSPSMHGGAVGSEIRRGSSAVMRLRGLDGMGRSQQVCPLIYHLDLSNNGISALDWDTLFGLTFVSLRRLVLAGNALESLCGGGGDEAHASSFHEYPRLLQLDVSANRLRSLEGVQRFSSLTQLVAYGNSIKQLPNDLAVRCPLLSVIEVSRNQISDLAPLSGLRDLQSLDCSRNAVQSLQPLTGLALLQKLYLSNNAIEEIPTEMCCVFLQHLFISDNKLSHLNGLVSFPFLSVLHAESNRLVDIEGLRGCRLLTTVTLAFNDLPNVEALLPLGYAGAFSYALTASSSSLSSSSSAVCFERLSFNDNPVMAEGGGSSTTSALLAALVLCPTLRDVNNEPVTPQQRAEAATRAVEEALAADILPWREVRKKQRDIYSDDTVNSIKQHYVRPLLDLFAYLRREYIAVSLHLARREQRAVKAELNLAKSIQQRGPKHQQEVSAEPDNNNVAKMTCGGAIKKSNHSGVSSVYEVWATGRDSSEAFVDQQFGTALMLTRHYQLLAKACRDPHGEGGALTQGTLRDGDRFRLSTLFDSVGADGPSSSALGTSMEMGARDIIRRFLLGIVMTRRAKHTLAHLKATTTRYADAATRIQATFRGHRVRRMLSGAGLEDDDDDMLFQKVSFEDDGRGRGAAAGTGLNAVMRGTLQQRGTAPVFEVRKMVPTTVGGGGGAERVGSAPSAAHALLTTGYSNRPSSQPLARGAGGVLQPTPPSTDPPSPPPPPIPTDEWSTAMRQHQHKKQAKAAKQQADAMRREFINDPLKARQLYGGGGGGATEGAGKGSRQ